MESQIKKKEKKKEEIKMESLSQIHRIWILVLWIFKSAIIAHHNKSLDGCVLI